MRENIVIKGKCAFKSVKRPPIQQKQVRDNRENSARERNAEFGGANNALVAISLESTVGSCWFLDILFFSHSSTNWPFEGTQSVWQKSSSEISWKTKGNTFAGQFWSPTDFSLFHRCCMPIFGYVACLDVAFILDGVDQKCILWQDVVRVEQ